MNKLWLLKVYCSSTNPSLHLGCEDKTTLIDYMYVKSFFKQYGLHIALTQAVIATLASLYFSEIRHFPPCILCWYQRICMYPLVVILFVGIYRKDTKVYLTVLPLAIIGFCISLYHNLLYYKIIPEAIAPCVTGVSCTTIFIKWFGFVTIPFLSLVAFTVIIISIVAYMRVQKKS